MASSSEARISTVRSSFTFFSCDEIILVSFSSVSESVRISLAGVIFTESTESVRLCEIISKKLILSISSPKSSRRTGYSYPGGKISMIPPLTENCPTPSTISTIL